MIKTVEYCDKYKTNLHQVLSDKVDVRELDNNSNALGHVESCDLRVDGGGREHGVRAGVGRVRVSKPGLLLAS